MIWLLLLSAGLLLLLLVFVAGAIGQRHLYRSNPMSLIDDVVGVVGELKTLAEPLLAGLRSELDKAKADLEGAVAELAAKDTHLQSVLSELADLKKLFEPASADLHQPTS